MTKKKKEKAAKEILDVEKKEKLMLRLGGLGTKLGSRCSKLTIGAVNSHSAKHYAEHRTVFYLPI